MKTIIVKALIVFGLVFCGSSFAHHSFFAVFDGSKTVTVTGTVVQFRMVNPHAMMDIETVNDDGNSETWSVEFDGRLHLSRAGWNPSTFTVGQELAVTGNPAKSGSNMMFFASSIDDEGNEIVRPRTELEANIEEQRRQRRARREAQN